MVCVLAAESLNHVRLFVTPWTAACQVSLSFTISQSLLRFLSTESVMLLTHLILRHPLFLLPSIFPSIRVFSNRCVVLSYSFICSSLTVYDVYHACVNLAIISCISSLKPRGPLVQNTPQRRLAVLLLDSFNSLSGAFRHWK